MSAELKGSQGNIELNLPAATVGRDPGNQLVINDTEVSWHHAEIFQQGQGHSIVDLGSRNGTFVNEQKLLPNTPRPLRDRDTMRFGNTIFTYANESLGYLPTRVASPSYTPPPPPPQQAYSPPAQQAKPVKEKGSNRGWIITGIVVPLLAALIAGGYFGVHATTSGPSIPTLHSTYAGTAINLVTNTQFAISMVNVAENTSTGEFTANGSAQLGGVSCVGQVTNGLVKTDGSITFEFQVQANVITGCTSLVSNFTGQVDSAGNIKGTWSSDAGGNGSFTLS